MTTPYQQLDAWIDAHFDEQVRFLQELVRVPTDTPPGNNAPHADRTAELLVGMGLQAEKHSVPASEVQAAGMQSITNLVVRRKYGQSAADGAGGAGHDAMKLHTILPQAMQFVRGLNSGISHNPLESTTSDDMQLAVDAFSHLLHQLAHAA